MFKVLVVEDDKNLRKLIMTTLQKNGYVPFGAINGLEALAIMEKEYVDLIISDIMMPKMDGIELTKDLRGSNYKVPILLMTAKGAITDKREGFLAGADDYMVKPIDIEELVLRVKVLLRRANVTNEKKIRIGQLVLDYSALSLVYKQKEYPLAQKEFYLLYKLLSMPNVIFTRQDLMEEIWGIDSDSEERTVDVHIKRIREKLMDIPEFEILTIRGIGYKAVIREPEKAELSSMDK